MNISLTPTQESLIQTKLQTGKYRNIEEVLEIALQLLDERDRSEIEWIEDIREKIDEAIANSVPSVDGETFTNEILQDFRIDNSSTIPPLRSLTLQEF
jgi:antitoxin ParD1/3/4